MLALGLLRAIWMTHKISLEGAFVELTYVRLTESLLAHGPLATKKMKSLFLDMLYSDAIPLVKEKSTTYEGVAAPVFLAFTDKTGENSAILLEMFEKRVLNDQ